MNKFGWGIDGLFCSASHVSNRLVVIDTKAEATHPFGTRGYDGTEAHAQKNEFLKQYTVRERFQYELLRTRIRFMRTKITEAKK